MKWMGSLVAMMMVVVGCASAPVVQEEKPLELPRNVQEEAPTEAPEAAPRWVEVDILELPAPHRGYRVVANEIFLKEEGDRYGSWHVNLVSIEGSPRVLVRRQHNDDLFGERDEATGRWRFTPVPATGVLVLVKGEPRIVQPYPYGDTLVVWGLVEGRWVELERKTFPSQIGIRNLPDGFGILGAASAEGTLWTKVDGRWQETQLEPEDQQRLGTSSMVPFTVNRGADRKSLAMWSPLGTSSLDRVIPAPELFPPRGQKSESGQWEERNASVMATLMLKEDTPALITQFQRLVTEQLDCVEFKRPGPPGGPGYRWEACNEKLTTNVSWRLSMPTDKGLDHIDMTGLLDLKKEEVRLIYRHGNKISTRPSKRVPMAFASDGQGGFHTVLLDGASVEEGTRLRYVHITP